jgi:meiotically up-regulated gene 157 (Mug157) protein
MLDPFANAFNYNASGGGHQDDQRKPPMNQYIFEGKYELDSLMSFLKVSYWHYRYSGNKALKKFANDAWLTAVASVLKTVNTMQIDDGQTENPPYLFQRLAESALDTLPLSGRGPPVKPFGLSKQLFRPSDDAVTHAYNLAGNMRACVELKHLSELLQVIGEEKLKSDSNKIGAEICGAIDEVLKISEKLDTAIPYEIDGYGGTVFMDDANMPSLLSIPILGFMSNSHNIYKKTRDRVFSLNNPYFYKGVSGFGIGGPHEGRNFAWPMYLIVAAMTSNNDEEITELLNVLKTTTANTGLMHEAFNVHDASDFTRSWFAWANGLLGELILQLIVTKPKLLLKDDPDIIKYAQSLVNIPVSLQVQLDLEQ